MPRLILFLITIVIHHNVAVSGESPVNGYSHNAENSGYDHSNSLTSEKYLMNDNEYRTVPNSYSSVSQRSQYSSLGGGSQMSTTTNSYNGFPAYGHGNRLSAYSTLPHEAVGSNSYSMGSLSSTNSEGHSTGSNIGKSTFEGYSSIANNEDPELNQYTNNNNYQRPHHVGYSTDLSGQSSATNYNGNTLRTPAFEAYVGQNYHDAASYSPSTYSPTLQTNDYAFGKQKDSAQETIGSSNKYENEIFIGAPDVRHSGGNFGGGHAGYNHGYTSTRLPGSNFYLASIPGSSQSSSTLGKGNKHNVNKYMSNYIFATGTNYSPKNHENNYMPEAYVKNNGRIIIIKESSPIKYSGSAHSNGPVYSSSVPGVRSYKSKASNFMSSHGVGYPSSSMFSTVPISGISSSSSSGSSSNNYDTSYAGSHSPRGYINNRGHMNHEHTNVFSAYP